MGVHRSRSRWLVAGSHLVWPATAVAVLLVTAAVTYASRPASRPSDARAAGPGGVQVTGTATPPLGPPAGLSPGAGTPDGASGSPGGQTSPGGTSSAQGSPGTGSRRSPTGGAGGLNPTTGPAAPTGAFTARYQVGSAWTGGYVASVSVANGGTVAATWRLEIRLPQGVAVATLWNGAYTTSGDTVTITPEQGQALAPGSTVNVGYLANRTSQGTTPLTCTINGRACQ